MTRRDEWAGAPLHARLEKGKLMPSTARFGAEETPTRSREPRALPPPARGGRVAILGAVAYAAPMCPLRTARPFAGLAPIERRWPAVVQDWRE